MPDVAIVSIILLWLNINIVSGTNIINTDTAAPAPALDIPPEIICDIAFGSVFSSSL